MLHSHGIRQTADDRRHLVNITGNKQTDEMGGQQNETPMTMCCYSDVALFTKNSKEIYSMKLFHCYYYFM